MCVCRERERQRERERASEQASERESERERERGREGERESAPRRSGRKDTQAGELVIDDPYAGGVALTHASARTEWPRKH